MQEEEPHYFYGKPIFRLSEQDYVRKLLAPWRDQPASEELQKKIWDLLQEEKREGRISIPFKVVMRRDPTEKFADVIEVILDTKV